MRRVLIFGVDTGLAALFGVMVIAVAAQSLPVESVGTLALVIALVTLQIQIATLGLDKLLYARFSRNKQLPLTTMRHVTGIVGISGMVFFLGGIGVSTALASETFAIVYALGALRLIFTFSEVVRAGFRARQKPECYIFARLVSTCVATGILLVGLALKPSLPLLAMTWSLEWVLFSVILTIQYPSLVLPSLRLRTIKISLRKSLPTLVQMASVGLYYRFDQLYIGWRLTPEDLGVYAVGARVAEAGNMLFGLLGLVVTPLVIHEFKHLGLSPRVRRYAFVLGGITAIFLVLAWTLGPRFISYLFGSNYIASGQIFMIYALAAPFTVLGFTGSAVSVASGAYKAPMVSGLVTVVVCVISTVALVELYGLRGAALATVISYSVAAAIVWTAAWRQQKLRLKPQ